MTTFDGVYLRDSLNDPGTIPSPTNQPYISPDIIPYGTETLPIEEITSPSFYNRDIGKAFITDKFNNVYVRGKNLSAHPKEGSIALYYSQATLLFTPNRWIRVDTPQSKITLSNGGQKSTLASGQIGITNPPFLVKGPKPRSGDHYCFVATVNDPDIPKTFSSNEEFSLWVRNNPAVAWRNVSLVPAGSNVYTTVVEFGNASPQEQDFFFEVTCDGYDIGTTLNIRCVDAACPINVQRMIDTTGTVDASFAKRAIPGNFNTQLIMEFSTEKLLPSGASTVINYYQLQRGSKQSMLATPYETACHLGACTLKFI